MRLTRGRRQARLTDTTDRLDGDRPGWRCGGRSMGEDQSGAHTILGVPLRPLQSAQLSSAHGHT